MSDGGKCWALVQGCYSDYRVMYVLGSEDAAEELAAKLTRPDDPDPDYGSGYRVEEFPFFSETPPTFPTFSASTNVYPHGMEEVRVEEWQSLEPPPERASGHQSSRPYPFLGQPERVVVRATGGDRAGVIKSVKDRAAAVLANFPATTP